MTRRAACFALALAACAHAGDEPSLVDVRRADLILGVEVSGELEAVDSTDIKPPSIGHIWSFKIAMLATEGADVKQGEPVVAFDRSEQIRDLENMRNEADAAQKKLDKKKDDALLARRDEELKIAEAEAALKKARLKLDAPDELVASVERKTLELDSEAARLALERVRHKAAEAKRSDAAEIASLTDHLAYAKRRVELLVDSIKRLTVGAPRAGTIVYPTGWRGEKKKVGDQAWRMETVLQIVGLGKMIGSGDIDEVDMARVAVKQPVVLRLDALPDVQLHGRIKSIATSVHAKSNTDPSKVATVKVALEGDDKLPLRPGMRFRGTVELERVADVVQVPADAVFVTAEGPVVYRERGGSVERANVVLGRRNAAAIEVVSGLAPGDRVSRSAP
jgi:multidrug resistance efflux pump